MEPEEKKLYLEIKKGEKSDIKAEGFDNFISEMKKVGTIEDLKRILQNGENKQQIKTQQNISTWEKLYADISGYLYSTPERKDPVKLELYVTQLTQLVDILKNNSTPVYLPADYWPVYHKEQETHIEKFSSLLNSIEKTLKYYNHVKQEPETPEPENKFLNIFKEGGYELFCYLNEKYTLHDKKLPTKYSNLYRFLDYEQFIVCTQDQYREFIQSEFGVKKFSKVTKGNYRYEDNVFNSLTRFKSQYKNQLKSTKKNWKI